MTVEHCTPQSVDRNLANVYENLLYACWFCNRARSNTPLHDEHGTPLLDPTVDAWADHFEVVGDRLVPRTERGTYAEIVYDINDERKVRKRKARRQFIHSHLERRITLIRLANRLERSDDDRARTEAEILKRAVRDLEERMRRYLGVPEQVTAEYRCRCATQLRDLPHQLERQLVEL
ncbi:hypothetical protein [Polyangium spumosum]|uniref:HNH domain-containing protein n=1 Tax=Polyangium spumosum TaxID=889282 RepID=A0A6N7PVF1_9BACT|nr:hypothetical protein [Polyangium spumosum]MRG95537.1 hypothetical protein [Polyangium spumosum]